MFFIMFFSAWVFPLKKHSSKVIVYRWTFAGFMLCTMLGSIFFSYITRKGVAVENLSVWLFIVAAFSLLVPVVTQVYKYVYFCVFFPLVISSKRNFAEI